MARVAINLVTWNGEKYLPYLFESLKKQTYVDWEISIIDNGSRDSSVSIVQNFLSMIKQKSSFKINHSNLGYTTAYNEAMINSDCEYLLLLNQDMVLAPDFLQIMISEADQRPDYGSFQSVLLYWPYIENEILDRCYNRLNSLNTQTIDSLGLQVFKSRQVIDRDQGVMVNWPGHEMNSRDIFGVSGALPLFRKKALEEIRYNNEFFDQDFFSYKEDVDLAFRLQIKGWKSFLVVKTFAWHDRSASNKKGKSDLAIIKNRLQKNDFINYYSYRNQILLLIKNEFLSNYFRDFFAITYYEFKKFIYCLFLEQKSLRGYIDVIKLFSKMKDKRKNIMQGCKLSANDLRLWFE